MNADGSNPLRLTNSDHFDGEAQWSPDGAKIAFVSNRGSSLEVFTMNADGSNPTNVSNKPSFDRQPNWSPDGSKIAFASFRDGNWEIYTMNADGTNQINLTNDAANDLYPAWSPDGTNIAFESNRGGNNDAYTMAPNGTDVQPLASAPPSKDQLDWQPIPAAYARPKGATPTRIALVTANNQCTAPNRTHGAPLAFGSCAPVQLSSNQLTVGTGDSNARPALMQASLRFDVSGGDVAVTASLNDVFNKDLSDYTGNLRASVPVQMTDKSNSPSPGGPGPGTVQSFPLQLDIGCGATPDPNAGANCSVGTTMNALQPGAVVSGRRAIWELGQAKVYDGNGGLFAVEGVFVP